MKNLFRNVLRPTVRGGFKCLPLVNPIMEIYRNRKAKLAGQPLPHNQVSIFIQLAGTVAVIAYAVYAVANGLITKEQALEIFKMLA